MRSTHLPKTGNLIHSGIDAGLHLGAQLSVDFGGECLDLAFGEVSPGEPLTPDHRMPWQSGSKPLTAVAIAQLVQRGLVSYDDPVAEHIPEFGQGGKEKIIIWHLLTHTAGIRMFSTGWPHEPWEQIIATICKRRLEPRWVPGEKAGYHLASSWFILAEILQRVTGSRIAEYLESQVFGLVGMTESSLGVAKKDFPHVAPQLAPVYNAETAAESGSWASSPWMRHPWTDPSHLTQPSPGSNAVGPMRDLAKFYADLLNRSSAPSRLLPGEAIANLRHRHRRGLFDHTFQADMDWGLGFVLNAAEGAPETMPYAYGPHASPQAFGHSGYRSVVAFADPEADLAVAMAWNATPSEGEHRRRCYRTLEGLYEDLGLA